MGSGRQHLEFLRSSDELLATVPTDNWGTRASVLAVLREELEKHFVLEEKRVFEGSAEILSPAQADIPRINFASRKGVDL